MDFSKLKAQLKQKVENNKRLCLDNEGYIKNSDIIKEKMKELNENKGLKNKEDAKIDCNANAIVIQKDEDLTAVDLEEQIRKELKARKSKSRIKLAKPPIVYQNSFDPLLYYKLLSDQIQVEKEEEKYKENGHNLNSNFQEEMNKLKNIRNLSQEFKNNELFIWFNSVFQQWEKDLKEANLNENPNESSKDKLRNTNLLRQCRRYCKPLLSMFKQGSTPKYFLEKLFELMIYTMNRDYIKANECYYALAIGKSPWPKAEGKFSIHHRHTDRIRKPSDIAHIFNNETTKKYLHGIKRVVSYCQGKNPNKPSLNVTS